MHDTEAKWINHAYDYFVCGRDVIGITPDGLIWSAIRIMPIDRWRTRFLVDAWSPLTSEVLRLELDEYAEVLVIDR